MAHVVPLGLNQLTRLFLFARIRYALSYESLNPEPPDSDSF